MRQFFCRIARFAALIIIIYYILNPIVYAVPVCTSYTHTHTHMGGI